jgi:hypothetical protein
MNQTERDGCLAFIALVAAGKIYGTEATEIAQFLIRKFPRQDVAKALKTLDAYRHEQAFASWHENF